MILRLGQFLKEFLDYKLKETLKGRSGKRESTSGKIILNCTS